MLLPQQYMCYYGNQFPFLQHVTVCTLYWPSACVSFFFLHPLGTSCTHHFGNHCTREHLCARQSQKTVDYRQFTPRCTTTQNSNPQSCQQYKTSASLNKTQDCAHKFSSIQLKLQLHNKKITFYFIVTVTADVTVDMCTRCSSAFSFQPL